MDRPCNSPPICIKCDPNLEPGGPDGVEIVFTTEFEILPCANLERLSLVGVFSADNYIAPGGWKINGIDQAHIPHGSYTENLAATCIPFEITAAQGGLRIGVNTVEITVKNGHITSGMIGWAIGLTMVWNCIETDGPEDDEWMTF